MAPSLLRLGRARQSARQTLLFPRCSPQTFPPRRHASTSPASSALFSAKLAAYSAALAVTLSATYLYATDTRAGIHQWLVPRLLRVAFPDAEDAHHFGTSAMRTLHALGLHPRERAATAADLYLPVDVFGTTLQNPVAISAGLDKDAEVPDALFALGAAVVEVGGCTPRPQQGNPRPRVFRIPGLDGMVNRYGLNSAGADAMGARLRRRVQRFARERGMTEQEVLDGKAGVPPGSLLPGRLLMVQVAKNKDTPDRDAAADYVHCVRRLARYADVVVVNVSSPNTPGLRDLQAAGPLTALLGAVADEAARTGRRVRPRVVVKVSPDEDADAQVAGIVRAVVDSGVDGVIVGNTTRSRKGLVPPGVSVSARDRRALAEEGGFSGPAMFERTLQLVRKYRKTLDRYAPEAGEDDRKVIFATGGITTGRQALQVLHAGASVAMVYTGLVYGGAGTVTRLKQEIIREIGEVAK